MPSAHCFPDFFQDCRVWPRRGVFVCSLPFSTKKGIPMSEPKSSVFSDNAAGAIAYITFLPAVAFLILVPYKKSPFVRFHAWQSVYLNFLLLVVSYALGFVLSYCGISGLFFAVPTICLIRS